MRDSGNRRSGRVVAWATLGVIVGIITVAIALDWGRIRPVITSANWHLLLPAVALALASYTCSGLAAALVNRVFGLPVPMRRLFLVGFVTMAVNNLVTLAGTAAYGVSAVLLKRRDIKLSDILAASVFNTYLHFLVGTTFLPLALLYLVLSGRLAPRVATGLSVVTGAATVAAVLLNVMVLSGRVRRAVLGLVRRLVRLVARRDPAESFGNFDAAFTHGERMLRARPGAAAGIALLVGADWSACILALWSCTAAFGAAPSLVTAASGFFVAIAAGGASMLPGGLGVQDGSMAGVYALLGMPLEQALLASVLFRAVYYFLPFLAGLVIYWRILHEPVTAPPPPGS